MIKRIVFSFLFIFLIMAVILSTMGITHIDLTDEFMSFLKNTAKDANDINIQIPSIPKIVTSDDTSGILKALASIVNALIMVVNVISMILNFIITLFLYILMLVKNLGVLIGSNLFIINVYTGLAIA